MYTALRRIISIVGVLWAVWCEKVAFKLRVSFREKKIRGVQKKSPVTILNSSERRSKKLLRRNTRRWSARYGLFRECYLPAWLKGEDWRNETVIWRWGSLSNSWIKARLWERLQIKESNGVSTRHMHSLRYSARNNDEGSKEDEELMIIVIYILGVFSGKV